MPHDPHQLYTVDPAQAAQLDEPALLVVLDGYVDAGNAAALAAGELALRAADGEPLVRFDSDLLIDYRSRRPRLTYSAGAFVSFDAPRLQIRRATDAEGTDFLLMTGPEPDARWEQFAAAVGQLVKDLKVRRSVFLLAIPMTVPHTRPLGMSEHSSTPGLVELDRLFPGPIMIPGHAAGLLELRLGEAGHEAIGLAAHVPHYLAGGNYPEAAAQLLRAAEKHTGLALQPGRLEPQIAKFADELAAELAGNEEVAGVVTALEEQYDAFVAASGRSLLAQEGELPSGDDLAASFEAFLAEQDPREK